jgi:tetratricopeptide (TPR) repeat protein
MPASSDQAVNGPLAMAQEGIRLREAGDYAEAAGIFKTLIDDFPHLVYGWQEMAVLHALQGAAQPALRLFAQAFRTDPADFQPCKHLALHQIKLGLLRDARTTFKTHLAASPQNQALIDTYLDFIGFIEEYPENRALALVNHIEQGGRFLSPALVEDRILTAVDAKTPLSLIRLGDGEGAWLFMDPAEEQKYARLYEANRRKTLKVWFGTDSHYKSPSFMATRQRLMRAIRNADIIGIPTGLRIANEYKVSGLNGVPSSVNILRQLADAATNQYCTQDTHIDLHLRGFFPRLLAMPIEIGVISCHPDLGYRLAKSWGARVVQALIVPEEMGFTTVIDGLTAINGVSGMLDAHFPIVFNRIMETLRQGPLRARVWLVAAGYFGKIYCDAIRDSGAIALDIGSIVDGWSGNITRPYLARIQHFELA